MAALALHKRPFDLFVVVFLLVHIPVTLFVDSQAGRSARLPCLASSDMHEAKMSMWGTECVPATTCDIYMVILPMQSCQETGIPSRLSTS